MESVRRHKRNIIKCQGVFLSCQTVFFASIKSPCNESSSALLFRYDYITLSLCDHGWLERQNRDRSKRQINHDDLPPTRDEFAFGGGGRSMTAWLVSCGLSLGSVCTE